MNPVLKVDDSEFQQTLKKYLAVTPKELSEVLNTKMFYIVRGAVRALPKVEKSKIEQDVGVSGYELQYQKEREKKPRVKKTNYKRALKRGAKNARKQLGRDAKAFKRDIGRFAKSLFKSASKTGRKARKQLRKALR
jgi:hypothetical protein